MKAMALFLFLVSACFTLTGLYLITLGTGPIVEAHWVFIQAHWLRVLTGFGVILVGYGLLELSRLAALKVEIKEINKRMSKRIANRTTPRKPNELAKEATQ